MTDARTSQTATSAAETPTGGPWEGTPGGEDVVASEVLVEEVSIDGMCGVY